MRDAVDRPAAMTWRHAGPAALAAVLFVIAAAFAMSIDVVRSTFGIKSDEATYVAMALSAAHDGDLTYERRDLERFWALYHLGPEGIFLKRGQTLRVRGSDSFPFVRVVRRPDPRADRLYYGKAIVYPLVAAPFVLAFGLNGIVLLHVLLLAAVCVCGYAFLAARSSSPGAALFTTAFVGAASVADIIVRTSDPIDHLDVSAESPIRTILTLSMGAGSTAVTLAPGTVSTFAVPAESSVRYLQSHAYLMSVRSSEGFVPHLQNPGSGDYRNLGALMRFSAVTGPAAP